MKRILTLLAVLACFAATAQIPGSTTVNSRYDWLGGHFKQLKLPAYADTTDVPDWAPWLSGDAMLDTSGGNAGTIYVRYGSPRKWHAVSGSGGSGGGISEWIAGFGLLQVNDSTGAVDTSLIASRDRLYQQRDSLLALINLRMKYTDTASALSGYVRVGRFLDSLTAHQTRIQTKVAFTDTAAQTAGYTRVTRFLDSLTNHQTRIQTKVAFTDTATQMSGYVRKNVAISTGYGLTGGGDFSTSRTHVVDTATLFPAVRATVPGATATLSPLAENARTSYRINLSNEDTIVTTGDSFTVQYGVSAGEGWNYIFQDRFGMPIVNLAASGRGAWYAALGANTNLTQQMSRTMLTMFGINDIRRGTGTATYKKLASGTRSVIANNLISVFTAADAGTNTFSGTWTSTNFETYGGKSGTIIGGNGKFNNASGSYIEYTATGSDFLVGYLSNVTGGFSGGNFDVSIDGAVLYHVTADQADGISDGSDANTIMPGVLFIRGLTNASHTIRVTNSSNNYVYIDYFATVKKPAATSPVLISLLPHLNAAGYATAPANGSDAAFNLADDSLKAVIACFSGWPVRYVPVNEYYNTSTNIQADNIHPNVLGYKRLADAFASGVDRINPLSGATAITSLNGLTGTTQTFPTFGATGTTPNVVSTGTTHTFNFPLMAATSVTSGMLSNTLQTIPGEKHWSAGQQIFGALGSPSNGGALEMEYTSSTSFLSSLDRSGTTWKAMQFRALTYDFLISNSSMGSVSSTFWKFGNVSNPNTLYVDVTGKVGIATSTPRSAFEVRAGTAKFVGPIGFSGSQIVDSTGADIAFINRSDSIIKRMSLPALITLIGSSGATANTNLGSGFRILTPTAQGIKTLTGSGITIDSVTTGQLGLTNNLTSGISGGQTAIGGTGATDVLNIHATSANTTGTGIALNIGAKNTAGVPTESISINNAGMVGILTGVSTPTSNLQVNGSFAWVTSSVNQDLTMDASVMMWRVDASGANRTITLPATPANFIGRVYIIKKSDSSGNTVTIVGTINGTSNRVLNTQHTGYILISNGTDWDIIGSF